MNPACHACKSSRATGPLSGIRSVLRPFRLAERSFRDAFATGDCAARSDRGPSTQLTCHFQIDSSHWDKVALVHATSPFKQPVNLINTINDMSIMQLH